MEKNKIIDKLLAITEQTIVPMTQKSILQGNKIFGAAILNKADLSLIIASTNHETENPLWHGEIHTLKKFYEIPKNQRPLAKDCLFFRLMSHALFAFPQLPGADTIIFIIFLITTILEIYFISLMI